MTTKIGKILFSKEANIELNNQSQNCSYNKFQGHNNI